MSNKIDTPKLNKLIQRNDGIFAVTGAQIDRKMFNWSAECLACNNTFPNSLQIRTVKIN